MTSRRILTGIAVLCLAGTAAAEVSRQGEWPAEEKKVSLSVKQLPRAEAVKQLAQKAGWSVLIEAPSTAPVDVEVKDQPADKVLELLLTDGHYVAKRDGTLISIAPAVGVADAATDAPTADAASAAEAAAGEAAPAAPPAPEEKKGEDRVVTGGSTRVEAGETVHDLVVMGGSAEVLGTVTGDVSVMGGSVKLRKGGRVKGDVSVVGGSFDAEDGSKVDGDVDVVGGKARRGDGNIQIGVTKSDGHKSGFARSVADFGGSITRTALLFVFGTVLLALATGRMDAMQGEVAARPMRTLALGLVGSLVAAIAVIALCVTVVGIPIAIVALLLGVLGTYAGICAALTTLGAAVFHHKSQNPYVHLAVGCALFLVASWLPWVGGLVTAAVVLFGIGALVATRGAGVFPRKVKNDGPYRTAAV
ncbi:MAG: hypothetical protein HYZ29_25895 [Myxococcales bacterium]|nr:hypothetical protein [Myxococcales bacterium]